MNKISFLVFLVVGFTYCTSKEDNVIKYDLNKFPSNIAFFNEGNIYYYVSNTKKQFIIHNSSNPNISPNGTELAFTESIEKQANSGRRVSVLNIVNGIKITIPCKSEQVYGAVWSHKGNKLALNVMMNDRWKVGVVENKKDIMVLDAKSSNNYHNVSWGQDDSYVLTHTLDTLFFIDISGIVKRKIPIKEFNASSGTIFTLTKDERFIIFNARNLEATFCNDNEYRANVPDAIFKYDLELNKLVRLTPNDFFCGNYQIIDDIIYFDASLKCNKHRYKIYKMNLEGKGVIEILDNAHKISISPVR
jgi:Tol biopolymer transport system component